MRICLLRNKHICTSVNSSLKWSGAANRHWSSSYQNMHLLIHLHFSTHKTYAFIFEYPRTKWKTHTQISGDCGGGGGAGARSGYVYASVDATLSWHINIHTSGTQYYVWCLCLCVQFNIHKYTHFICERGNWTKTR